MSIPVTPVRIRVRPTYPYLSEVVTLLFSNREDTTVVFLAIDFCCVGERQALCGREQGAEAVIGWEGIETHFIFRFSTSNALSFHLN
jgi:hypothetical protein